jgi:acyl-coenzyme A thioesterase PaaI-like protein
MSKHEEFHQFMKNFAAEFHRVTGQEISMPPPSVSTIETIFTDFDFGNTLVGRVYYDKKFANPLGFYQGGFLCAAIDNVLGPLVYASAKKAVVTVEMSTSFIRPFTAADEYIDIYGSVVSRTKSIIILKAEVKNKEGKLRGYYDPIRCCCPL